MIDRRFSVLLAILVVLATRCSATPPGENIATSSQAYTTLTPRGEELINVQIASRSPGTLDLIAVGASHSQLFHRHWNGTNWQPQNGFEQVTVRNAIFGIPSVVANGPTALDVFAVEQGTGNLIHYYWDGSFGANDYFHWYSENLGGSIEGSPAAVAWDSTEMDVFAVSTVDGAVYRRTWSGSSWGAGAWSANWSPVGGSAQSSPAVVSAGPGQLDLFVIGAVDKALYHKYWNGSGWVPSGSSVWDRLAGSYTGRPSAVSWGSGRSDVFAIGADQAVYHWGYYNGALASPNGESLGGQVVGSPSASSWGANRLDVTVTGAADGAVYHKGWIGPSQPSGMTWDRLAGQVVGSPSAVSWGDLRYDVIVAGAYDGQVYHKRWDTIDHWWPCENCDNWEALGAAPSPAMPANAPWLILTCKFKDKSNDYTAAKDNLPTLFTTMPGVQNIANYYSTVSAGYVDVSTDAPTSSVVYNDWLDIGNYGNGTTVTSDYFTNYCGTNDNGAVQKHIMNDCLSAYNTAYNAQSLLEDRYFYGVGVITNYGNFSLGEVVDTMYFGGFGVIGTSAYGSFLIGPQISGCNNTDPTPEEAVFDLTRVAHEMGHGFGMSHAHGLAYGGSPTNAYAGNWDDEYGAGWTDEYYDWDLMACMGCGEYSGAFGLTGPGLNAGHISQQNWFSPNDRFTYLGGTQIVSLVPINRLGAGYRFIRAVVRGLPQHYYTIALRSPTGYDRNLGTAVTVNEINAVNETVLQLKSAGNGEFLPGDSFTDSNANLKFTVLQFTNQSDPNTVTATVQISPAN